MDFKVFSYLVYICISLALTFFVGRALHKHGRVFLSDIFQGDDTLVDSINMLLLIGFYLINLGYILFNLISNRFIQDWVEVIEVLSVKVGTIVIVLGVIHLVNILILMKMRNKNKILRAFKPQESINY